MPELQVLQRTEDPTAKMISEGGTNIANILMKKREDARAIEALKLKAEELKITSQQAQTEEEKLHYDKAAKVIDYITKLKENHPDAKPEDIELAVSGVLKTMGESGMEGLKEAGTVLANIKKSNKQKLEEQKLKSEIYQRQQAGRANAMKADSASRNAAMTERMLGGNMGEGAPAGTTYNTATGGFTIPLNRPISAPEADTISKANSLGNIRDSVVQAIDSGILGKPGILGSVARTMRGTLVENPSALGTSLDPKLSEFRSMYNKIRQISLFDEAGKALTGPEKEEAMRMLELKGKSDEQVKKDLTYLIDKNSFKAGVLLGGSNAARSGMLGTPTNTGRIKVKSPDGRIGSIPANQLQDAISQGYAEVK